MSDLSPAQYQNQFLRVLFAKENPLNLPSNACGIYSNNLLYTAHRALSISYPIFTQMVGQQALLILTQQLLEKEKPQHGDWAKWGGKLKQIVSESELALDHPFLTDILNMEWLSHCAFTSAVLPLNRASFELLVTTELDRLTFSLQAGVKVLSSHYALDSIKQMHTTKSSALPLGNLHMSRGHFYFILYRNTSGSVELSRLTQTEFKWTKAVLKLNNISDLLEQFPNFDMPVWLQKAIQFGWIESLRLSD